MIKILHKGLIVVLCIAVICVLGYNILPIFYVDSVAKSRAFAQNNFNSLEELQENKAQELENQILNIVNVWCKNNGYKTVKIDKNCQKVAAEKIRNIDEEKTDFNPIKNYVVAYSINGKHAANAYQIVNSILSYKNITDILKGSKNVVIGVEVTPNRDYVSRFDYVFVIGKKL